jgi:hypothetical protein
METSLSYLEEPSLRFGYQQSAEDPRDGLALFGPLETFPEHSIQAGFVGTEDGLLLYNEFVGRLAGPIVSGSVGRPTYPGFRAVFGIEWPRKPTLSVRLDGSKLAGLLQERNLRARTRAIVDQYLAAIREAHAKEEARIDIWFIVVPRAVWRLCRPKSPDRGLSKDQLKYLKAYDAGQGLLFEEMADEFELTRQRQDSSADFHNQLKARLLQERLLVPVQIMLEPTLGFKDKYTGLRYSNEMQAHIAWTQSSSTYYKLGKLPWKLHRVREGVCYVGLVFKQYQAFGKSDFACSAAQMFLDSGDGAIFRGNIGPWLGEDGQYHLSAESAQQLLVKALRSYRANSEGRSPAEVFIHGRASFTNDEWRGFESAIEEVDRDTALVGVTIKESGKIKLFRDVEGEDCKYGNLRGLSLRLDDREAFLWTRGFVPRLNTSTSKEIPNPLRIHISRGSGDIQTVTYDVLSLTKLNYNACQFGDGLPVTLRFSDRLGGILTAVDNIETEVLPFKYYI